MFYNNVDLTPTLKGNLKNWGVPKTFSFTPVAGAVLAISGSEAGNCHGCKCSGLVVDCTASSHSGWDDISSHKGWMTQGYDKAASYPTDWQMNAYDDSGWGRPCTSSSGFSLGGSTEMKIWPANGKKFASFRIVPQRAKQNPFKCIAQCPVYDPNPHVSNDGEVRQVAGINWRKYYHRRGSGVTTMQKVFAAASPGRWQSLACEEMCACQCAVTKVCDFSAMQHCARTHAPATILPS